MRKYDMAVKHCSKAIKLDNSYLLAYANRGWAYYHLYDYKLAVQDLEEAMSIDPKSDHRQVILDHYTKAAVALESGVVAAPMALQTLNDPGKFYALIIGNNERRRVCGIIAND